MITDMITKIVITIMMNFYTRKIETNLTRSFLTYVIKIWMDRNMI